MLDYLKAAFGGGQTNKAQTLPKIALTQALLEYQGQDTAPDFLTKFLPMIPDEQVPDFVDNARAFIALYDVKLAELITNEPQIEP